MKKSTKIVVGSVVAAVGIAAIVCTTVEPVKDAIKNLGEKIKNGGKSDEQIEQEKNEVRQETTHEDEHYKTLTEEEKQEFDNKLEAIFEHDDYKNLSDDEKNDLVEKFVQSEKLQKEIQEEQEEQNQRQEEIKEELGALSEELNNIFTSEEELFHSEQVSQVAGAIANTKNELQDIINSNSSTADEIAEAQEKLDQVEALEQEYASSQTSNSIIESINNSQHFQKFSGNLTINKIKGIYSYGSKVLVDAEFIQTETIAEIDICSRINAFASIDIYDGFEDVNDYAQLVGDINNKSLLKNLIFIYTSSNEDWHKDYFEENRDVLLKDYINKYEECDAEVSVVSSWESTNDPEHPIYFVAYKFKSSQDILGIDMVKYNENKQSYRGAGKIQKICPEFWAQLEVEQENDAQSQSDSQASQNSAENGATSQSTTTPSKYEKLDTNGNLIGFDYASFQQDQAR